MDAGLVGSLEIEDSQNSKRNFSHAGPASVGLQVQKHEKEQKMLGKHKIGNKKGKEKRAQDSPRLFAPKVSPLDHLTDLWFDFARCLSRVESLCQTFIHISKLGVHN